MKTALKSLIYSLFFIATCLTANAQSYVDTLRIGAGVEGMSGNGTFGTGINTAVAATGSSAYKYGAGVFLHADVPLIEHFNLTVSAGYNTFFTTSNIGTSQQAITGTTLPNFETIPLKLGIKWFIGKTFYFQGEAGETLLANKAALYAVYSNAFTWSPQLGVLVPLKKKRTYIDGGIRYENFQSFYNDGTKNSFWAIHIAYAFNL
ncbi:hypothetical protein [Mucilaginibacter sp.]|uniref:hypothetical protein n=1 Tax=Mucilaginibacter sp. TaxID=1882438 RepID=UPI002603A3A0|nr:hypothetical protein [Mucilaginibacter sp.]MDB4924849.1 hypothetical protein [Mucilaginibacter sp.]